MFCLSKGLGAPIGSMLVGSKAFIAEARMHRKALGGGMRQAGVLAAAGLIALEEGPGKLAEDHANAQALAQAMQGCPGISVDAASIQTNIVFCQVADALDVVRQLRLRGVAASAIGPCSVRFVTHGDVSRAECLEAGRIAREICNGAAPDDRSGETMLLNRT